VRTLYFEDYLPGWSSSGGAYEVTQDEVIEFGRRFDPRPFHVDAAAAEASHFGGLVAPGCLVFCIRSRLALEQDGVPALIAGLGTEEMDLPNPVRPNDVLTMRQALVDARPSASRPDRGIVRVRSTVENHRGEPVLTMVAKLLVARRPRRYGEGRRDT
jgi:acyl dehydratase